MSDEVRYEKRDDHIAVITLDRPPVNAYTTAMMRELERVWDDVQADPQVWAVLFTSAEGLPFGVGADMKRMFHGEELAERRARPPRHQYLGEIKVLKPIVAAIDGYCLGGSMAMALGADLRVASDRASFGMSMVKRGLFPPGATQWLPRMVPRAIAMELLLTGERISAQRAYEAGLVNRVVAPEAVRAAALELAQKVCECAPLALQRVKELAYVGLNEPFDRAVAIGWELFMAHVDTQDAREGERAFRERRPPRWHGR